jgi:hypothetical protein
MNIATKILLLIKGFKAFNLVSNKMSFFLMNNLFLKFKNKNGISMLFFLKLKIQI